MVNKGPVVPPIRNSVGDCHVDWDWGCAVKGRVSTQVSGLRLEFSTQPGVERQGNVMDRVTVMAVVMVTVGAGLGSRSGSGVKWGLVHTCIYLLSHSATSVPQ